MGVTIGKGVAFLGVPLIKLRNTLKAWHHGNRSDLWRIGERKDINLDPRTVMVLLDELRDRGLLGPEELEDCPPEDGLTEAGLALAGAGARKRMPKQQAQAILDRFLDACAAVNGQDGLPFDIQRVWLFGSMLDPTKGEVGDIDLVVEQGSPPPYDDRMRAIQRFKELGKEMGAPAGTGLMLHFGDQIFVERQLLHGGRRHPILSKHQLHELRDMACPCQLIFDAVRGGHVSDPVLARHPDSLGRSNRIGDRRRMPDLTEGRQALRPFPLSLSSHRLIRYQTRKSMGPWPEDDFRYRAGDQYISNMEIMVEGMKPPRFDPNALSKRMRFRDCDGRDRAGLLLIETERINPDDWCSGYRYRPVGAVIIRRSFRQLGNEVCYELDLVEADHLGQRVNYYYLLAFEWWIHFIATTDVERLVRREQELGTEYAISVAVTYSAGRSVAAALDDMRILRDRPLVAETRERVRRQAIEGFRTANLVRG